MCKASEWVLEHSNNETPMSNTTLGVSSRSLEREVEGRVAAPQSNCVAVYNVRIRIRSIVETVALSCGSVAVEQNEKITCFQSIVRIRGDVKGAGADSRYVAKESTLIVKSKKSRNREMMER